MWVLPCERTELPQSPNEESNVNRSKLMAVACAALVLPMAACSSDDEDDGGGDIEITGEDTGAETDVTEPVATTAAP
jgi:hypothetical protein